MDSYCENVLRQILETNGSVLIYVTFSVHPLSFRRLLEDSQSRYLGTFKIIYILIISTIVILFLFLKKEIHALKDLYLKLDQYYNAKKMF